MDITFVLKIAAIGFVVALVNQVLQKAGKEEYTLLTTVAGVVFALLLLVPKLRELGEQISAFFSL